jgi:hypothetical protein
MEVLRVEHQVDGSSGVEESGFGIWCEGQGEADGQRINAHTRPVKPLLAVASSRPEGLNAIFLTLASYRSTWTALGAQVRTMANPVQAAVGSSAGTSAWSPSSRRVW